MRAYVQTLAGVHLNTQGARAEQGFRELGIECVEFLEEDDLEDMRPEDVMVANERMVAKRLAALGAAPSVPCYPEALMPYMGRRIWRCLAEELTAEDYPVFLRPVHEGAFHSIGLLDEQDRIHAKIEGEAWASEVVWFESTWRAYVRYGREVATLPCEGDPDRVPDRDVVSAAIAAWKDAPAGCAIDFGIDEGDRTHVARARDVITLSPLGLSARDYALVLAARWAELVGAGDALKGVEA